MSTERQRLTASHVKVGRPLPGDVYDDNGHLLLSAGFVIDSEPMLESLLSRGLYVDFATFQAHFDYGTAAAPQEAKKSDPFLSRDSLKKRLNRALRSLRGDPEALAHIREIAAAIHELAGMDAEGAIAAGLLDEDEDYAIRHSVLTAILCDLTGSALGWSDGKRSSVVCAALSMNAAMLDVQNKLVAEGALSPQQLALVRGHPEAAAAMLREAGVSDAQWLAAVEQHHERHGGSGYPRGMAEPGDAGQLLRLADEFGALASQRGDRKAMTPPQALRTMMTAEAQGPCAALAGTLAKVLGVFPPGTFVKLANGEIAVVHRHGAAENAPQVACITHHTGNPYIQPLRRDTGRKEFAIAGLTLRGKLTTGYDLAILWVRTLRSS